MGYDASGDQIVSLKNSITNEGNLVSKTVVFTGAAGLGAQGAVPVFTVTGDVLVSAFGVCTEDLVSAGGGSISLGTTAVVASLISATTATTIDAGKGWLDTSPAASDSLSNNLRLIANGDDIIATVTTGDITDGTITFYCLWRPLSTGATIVAA